MNLDLREQSKGDPGPGHSLLETKSIAPSADSNDNETDDASHPSNSLLGGPLPPYSEALREPPIGWWSLHSAWSMYLFLALSICFAAGHHMYYKSHDGAPAVEQTTTLRYGTALAFCTKTCLVWAVAIAWRQRAYTVISRKPLSLRGLDCLFATTDDPTALANRELFKHAKLVVFMACCCWIGPLMVILASQALSVEPTMEVATCPGAKTLNFLKESTEDWRHPTIINNRTAQAICMWNSTTFRPEEAGFFDYWNGPSGTIRGIMESAFRLSQEERDGNPTYVNPVDSPCGDGWNCKFNITFQAPGYKCTELKVHSNEGDEGQMDTFDDRVSPIDITAILPSGRMSYVMSAMWGDYYRAQFEPVYSGGILSNITPPFPKNLGAFRTEPIIWLGFAELADANTPREFLSATSSVGGWSDAFKPHLFACKMYETSYDVQVSYQGGLQTTHVLDRRYLQPVINTTFQLNVESNDGTKDKVTAEPASAYIFPSEIAQYKKVAAYHSLGQILRETLNGTVDHKFMTKPSGSTGVLSTNLLDPTRYWLPFPDLPSRLTSMFESAILSILTNPQMLVVTWAAAPDITTSVDTRPSDFDQEDRLGYPCIRSKPELRFRYDVRDLWLVYGASLLLAIGVVAIGTWSVLENGKVLQNTRYSTIHTLLQQLGLRYEALR